MSLRCGSLTAKRIGDRVERGEYLGVVGSSGYSGYPHLHFEVFDSSGGLIDPFAGPHNDSVAESWWRDQPPYYESRFLTLMTHTQEPTVACNNREWTWAASRFAPGDEAYLVAFLRDVRRGQWVRLRVLDPNGRVVAEEKHRARDPHRAIYMVTARLDVPLDAEPGTWTVRADFQGAVLEREFEIGESEPTRSVRAIKPSSLRAGARGVLRIRGSGFTRDLGVYITSPVEVDRHVRVVRARIRKKKITLVVEIDGAATPGERTVVLTAPDYTQSVLHGAFQVLDSPPRGR